MTAAHEYLHVVHNRYDTYLDPWVFESTSTWVEDQVHPANPNYYDYVNGDTTGWVRRSQQDIPITDMSAGGTKGYGLAVFLQFLSDRLGAKVVRQVWEQAQSRADAVPAATDPDGAQFRDLGATPFDAALKALDPAFGLAAAFDAFSAAQAEWRLPGSGFHDGPAFADLDRQETPLAVGAGATAATLMHLTSKLYDVTGVGSDGVRLTGTAAAGTPLAVALVGRKAEGAVTTRIARPGPDGVARAELPAGPYERVTAVVINHGLRARDFDADKGDWTYPDDGLAVTAAVTTVAPPKPPGDTTSTTATQTTGTGSTGENATPPAGGPDPAPAATEVAGPPAPPAVAASAATVRAAKAPARALLRRGLPVTVTTSGPARVALTLVAPAAAARRLGLGRVPVVLGQVSATVGGTRVLTVKLTRKAARALKSRKAVGAKLRLQSSTAATGQAKPAIATTTVTVAP